MAIKRGLQSAVGINKSKGIGSCSLVSCLVFFLTFLAFSFVFVGRGLFSSGQNELSISSSRQDLNWRQRLALQQLKSVFSKDVIDVINASTDDLGPLNVDIFQKNKLSAS